MKTQQLGIPCIAMNIFTIAYRRSDEPKNFKKNFGWLTTHWDEKTRKDVVDSKPTRMLKKLQRITGVDFNTEKNWWELNNMHTRICEAGRVAIEGDLKKNFKVYEHTITRVKIFNKVRVVFTLYITISHGEIFAHTTLFAGDTQLY